MNGATVRRSPIFLTMAALALLATLGCDADLRDGNPCFAIAQSACNLQERCGGYAASTCLSGAQSTDFVKTCADVSTSTARSCASDIDALACGKPYPSSCSSISNADLPPLPKPGTGGSPGNGGTGGSTGKGGAGGSTGSGGTGPKTGTGGGAAPADAGVTSQDASVATCATCAQAYTCCNTLGLPASTCNMYTTSVCNAQTTADARQSVINRCAQVVASGVCPH